MDGPGDQSDRSICWFPARRYSAALFRASRNKFSALAVISKPLPRPCPFSIDKLQTCLRVADIFGTPSAFIMAALRISSTALRTSLNAASTPARSLAFNGLRCYSSAPKAKVREATPGMFRPLLIVSNCSP